MHMQCNYNMYLQAGTHPPESCSMNSQHELSAWELNMMVADATSLHTNSQHELSTLIFVALHIDRRALAAMALAKGRWQKGVGRKANNQNSQLPPLKKCITSRCLSAIRWLSLLGPATLQHLAIIRFICCM